jgi:uncharacterized protein (TIGR02996 family)
LQPSSTRKHAQDLEQYLKDHDTFKTSILLKRNDGSMREAEIALNRATKSVRSVGVVHVNLHAFPKSDPSAWHSTGQSSNLVDYTCCPALCPADISSAFERMEKNVSGYEPLFESILAKDSKPGNHLYQLALAAWCELFKMDQADLPKDPEVFRSEQLKKQGIHPVTKSAKPEKITSSSAKKTKTWAESIDRAAASPAEFELITAIARNLPDHAAKMAYASWLDTNSEDEARARFVRELAELITTFKDTRRVPDTKAFPLAWSNMLGATIYDGIIKAGLLDVRDIIIKLAHPIMAIKTSRCDETTIPIGASKLGGQADLPEDFVWPVCSDRMKEQFPAGVGDKLGFLGQISLKDLELTQCAHSLPTEGLLSIFAYRNEGYQPGMAPLGSGDTRVFYTPPSIELKRRPAPFDMHAFNTNFPACQVAMTESWDFPDWCKNELPGDILTSVNALIDSYCEARTNPDRVVLAQQLFGRIGRLRTRCNDSAHHLLGYSMHNKDTEPSPGPEWVHLACFSSDVNLGWSWSEGKHLSIFVHRDDIKDRSFSRVVGCAS